MEDIIKQLIREIGDDPERKELQKTPRRVKESMRHLTSGYRANIDDIFSDAIYPEANRDMIVLRDIEVYSLCEHHLLPFWGKCHFGYIPRGQITGVSKIARLVDHFARRLQLQERMTHQIASAFTAQLQPLGVAVVIEAQHLCMMMRGVAKQNSKLQTSCMQGIFQKDPRTRAEFLSLIQHRG